MAPHADIARPASCQYDDGRQRMNTLRLDELDTRFPGLVSTVLGSPG